jgi:xanthine/uracil permease
MAERMQFMPIILASVTLISTGLGGMAALRFRDRLHLLLGFSSGAVIAVALFDIPPEIFALAGCRKSRIRGGFPPESY